MPIHLLMAGVWLAMTIGFFAWSMTDPNAPRLNVFGTPRSLGWFWLIMVVYNLVRWISVTAQRKSARAEEERRRRYELRRHRSEPERERERNPEFDFSDEPGPPD